MACALIVVLPAKAEPPKRCKEPGCERAPAPLDPTLNWRQLKVVLGVPRIEGGTVTKPEAALQKLKTSLFLCYVRSVTQGRKEQGSADFTLWLNSTGNVANVRVTSPQGKSLAQDLAACWSAAAHGAHFERPSREGVSVAFELQFSPEHGPPEPPEPTAKYLGPVKVSTGGQIAVSGAQLPDATLGVLRWGSTLKPCGDLARGAPDRTNGLLGAFELRMTVAADGKVSHVPFVAEVMSQSHSDPLLQKAVACVLEHAQQLQFASREGESQIQLGIEFRKAPSGARPTDSQP
jgi:hypothetical protein